MGLLIVEVGPKRRRSWAYLLQVSVRVYAQTSPSSISRIIYHYVPLDFYLDLEVSKTLSFVWYVNKH